MKIQKETEALSDIGEIYNALQEEYRNVFFTKIGEDVFFYRALNRKEHRTLITNTVLSDMEKEDVICQACTLWPNQYDFDRCDAGVPTQLAKEVLKNSFLSSNEDRAMILKYYRNEMYEIDNQVNCIINEAFPQFDIEEIEKWDIEKTSKYLSRAEWKLQNLRGMNMDYDPYEAPQEQPVPEVKYQGKAPKAVTEEIVHDQDFRSGETLIERQARLAQKSDKEKLTPEKLAELRAKFPEINWEADVVAREGIDAMKDSIDTKSPALRPGF